MRNQVLRFITGALAALVLTGVTGGIAQAAETPIWLVPGVDLGSILGPTVQLPTQALAPVFDLLGGIS